MPFVAVPHGYKVEHLATIYGRPMANVMGGLSAEPLDEAALLTAADALAASWITNMVGFAEAPYVYKGCRVTDLSAVDAPQAYSVQDETGAGSSDHNLPPSLACCATLLTAARSRSGRGRLYWPIIRQAGVVESNTTQLTDTFRNGLATNLGVYLGDAASTTVLPAVVSRVDAVARLIINVAIDHRVDHQRRRDG
jgi:hypothetical protein